MGPPFTERGQFTVQVFGNFNNNGLNISVCVCVNEFIKNNIHIIKYNTIFEEKMGFPANLELVFTLCWILGSNNKNIHEHMIIYNMYSEMLFLNIVRNCTHLFVKQTNKKEKYFFLWPLLKIQRSLLRRLNPSTYSAITYWHAIQGYIHYYLDM